MAAVMSLQPAQGIPMFRGDADNMVELLIAACEQAKKPVASGTGFEGRELVPWVDDTVQISSALTQPLEQPRRVSKFPNGPQKHARSNAAATRAPESPEHKRQAQPKRSKVQPAPRLIFACPALAASPKPESIPMPTTGLMNRCRGRSPSPVKDSAISSFFASPQLVRAMAA
eukprot:gene12170-12308_t